MRRVGMGGRAGIGVASAVRRVLSVMQARGVDPDRLLIRVAPASRVRTAPVKTGAVRVAKVLVARAKGLAARVGEIEETGDRVRGRASVARVDRASGARGRSSCVRRIVARTSVRTLR